MQIWSQINFKMTSPHTVRILCLVEGYKSVENSTMWIWLRSWWLITFRNFYRVFNFLFPPWNVLEAFFSLTPLHQSNWQYKITYTEYTGKKWGNKMGHKYESLLKWRCVTTLLTEYTTVDSSSLFYTAGVSTHTVVRDCL
jgi:hypothetical protein